MVMAATPELGLYQLLREYPKRVRLCGFRDFAVNLNGFYRKAYSTGFAACAARCSA
jgi:hypothetical protein